MNVVLTHVYNEEYLLNWWLPHHKKRFDHGIIVDYKSTDNTRNLVKKMVPNWELVTSKHDLFGAVDNTLEIMELENSIQSRFPKAWMITLTVTEFFIGNTGILKHKNINENLYVPCDIMVSTRKEMFVEPDPNLPLINQRTKGIPLEYNEHTKHNMMASKFDSACVAAGLNGVMSQRMMRSLHNYSFNYFPTLGPGRHAWNTPTKDFRIFWYGFSPITEKLISRKLQIKERIPQSDIAAGMGVASMVDRDSYLYKLKFHQNFGLMDLKDTVNKLEGNLYK